MIFYKLKILISLDGSFDIVLNQYSAHEDCLPSDQSHVSKSVVRSLPARIFSSPVFTKVPSRIRLFDGIASTERKFDIYGIHKM